MLIGLNLWIPFYLEYGLEPTSSTFMMFFVLIGIYLIRKAILTPKQPSSYFLMHKIFHYILMFFLVSMTIGLASNFSVNLVYLINYLR